jgi:ferrous iron transport protein A
LKTIADLKTGEKGVIDGFADTHLLLKFLEMGCTPGSEVELCCKAPFGSPVCIRVSGYHLGLRKEEAKQILLMETECPVVSHLK